MACFWAMDQVTKIITETGNSFYCKIAHNLKSTKKQNAIIFKVVAQLFLSPNLYNSDVYQSIIFQTISDQVIDNLSTS
jgi:hypothetical protein